MSKLYISEKTLNKLSKSKISQKYLNAFNHFDVEHSKSKQPQIKTKQPRPIDKTPNLQQSPKKELTQDEKIQLAIQEMKKAFAENKNTYHYSAEKAKRLSEELKAKKIKASLDKLSKQSTPEKPKVIKLKKKRTISKKSTKPLVHSLDYDNPAAEYESRQVEFGHGRAKSKEWNDEIARSLKGELRRARKQKPDWTDRFALK
ncbi:hypothetical protein J6V85_01260 [Candidatus Saccharibacteria bacterium]|nr:hypothetical protein [Candidatus Saccharibacteria bacterium]